MRRTLMQVCRVLILAVLQPSCGGGRSTLPPSATPATPTGSTVPTPTLLRTLYRVLNGGDRMTTVGPDQRSSYPLECINVQNSSNRIRTRQEPRLVTH
jgi:hypothetical protein